MDTLEEISKLKVTELRSELQSRGLDSKGVKAVLIERLRKAIEDTKDKASDSAEVETEIEAADKTKEDDLNNGEELEKTEEEKPKEEEEEVQEQNGEKDHQNGQVEEEVEPPIEEVEEAEEADEEMPEKQPENNKKGDFEDAPMETVDDIKKESEESEILGNESSEKTILESAEVKQETEMKEERTEVKEEMETNEEEEQHSTHSGDRRGVKRSRSPLQDEMDMAKKSRPDVEELRVEDEPEFDATEVALDWYNSDLSLIITKEDRLCATPLVVGGFAYVWHGVRATYGFMGGRIFYEVKVQDHLNVDHMENEEQHPHVVRCGWSTDSTDMILGEEKLSYGYGGTGKASTNLKFKDYGKTFSKGDVIGCFLDMEAEPIVMSFTVNGKHQGICYEIPNAELGDQALFPHILTKNCTFKVNFGSEEPSFEPLNGYTFVGKIPLEDRVLGTQGPEKREDVEAIMMVGLPAAGKTTWVESYCKKNPEKKYNVLGTNNLIDKMKVMGLPRKRNYHGRWDSLIEKCTKCLNKLLYMATKRRRNFIIDQTNVYPSAQKRKIKGFAGCKRRAIVVCPTDEDLKIRTQKRESEEGKDVPDRAVLEMKANFKLPEVGEFFDEIEFTELEKEETEKLIEQYNREGEKAGFGPKKFGRGGHSGRRGGSYIDRRGGYNHRGGGGGGGYRGGWDRDRDRRGSFDRRDRGGNWNRDNRDHRDRGGYRDRGFNRDRGHRGGGGGGGSWQGGFKGANQSNLKQTNTWGGSNQNSQNSGGYGGGSQGSWGAFGGSGGGGSGGGSSWGGQQGYNANPGYNWNQQYYGQQQQAQTPNYWQQGYGSQQAGYTAPTSYGTQSSYGTAQSNYSSYGQQQQQPQQQQQTTTPQWNSYTSTYQSNQYRKN